MNIVLNRIGIHQFVEEENLINMMILGFVQMVGYFLKSILVVVLNNNFPYPTI